MQSLKKILIPLALLALVPGIAFAATYTVPWSTTSLTTPNASPNLVNGIAPIITAPNGIMNSQGTSFLSADGSTLGIYSTVNSTTYHLTAGDDFIGIDRPIDIQTPATVNSLLEIDGSSPQVGDYVNIIGSVGTIFNIDPSGLTTIDKGLNVNSSSLTVGQNSMIFQAGDINANVDHATFQTNGSNIYMTSNGLAYVGTGLGTVGQVLMGSSTTAGGKSTLTIGQLSGQIIKNLDIVGPNGQDYFNVSQGGNVGIGTSTPWATLSVAGTSDLGNSALAGFFTATSTATSTFAGGLAASIFNASSTTASSTFANGINLTKGCFSIVGTCLGGGNYFTNVGATTTLNTGSELDAGSFVGTSTAPSTFLGNVGIGVSSPKGVLAIPNANFYSLTRTIPTTVGTEVDIGSFTLTNGSGNFEIWINVPSTGYSQSKRYFLPASFTPVAWATVLPIGTTGIYNATNDMDLDIQNSSGVTSLRLIRTAGTTAGTAQIVIEQEGTIGDVFTPSTATSATTIPTVIYGATTLTQLNGHTGVNVAAPTHGLDVEQDGTPGSANIIQTLTDNALFSGTGDSGTSEALQFNTIGYNGAYVFNIPAASITAIKENSWNLVSGGAENESIGFNTVGGGTFSQKAVLTSLGRLGIGTSTPYLPLSVAGLAVSTGYVNNSKPTIAGGTGDGSVTPSLTASSTDAGGNITLTTGATPSASGPIFTLTFQNALSGHCTYYPSNALTAALSGTTGTFADDYGTKSVMTAGTVALSALTTYQWDYTCTE